MIYFIIKSKSNNKNYKLLLLWNIFVYFLNQKFNYIALIVNNKILRLILKKITLKNPY